MNAVQSEAASSGVNFTIIGFPCNQFANQEPGDNKTEILNLAKYVRPGSGYEPNFPWYGPVKVNGHEELPLYTFLKDVCPPYQKAYEPQYLLMWTPISSGDVTWNFEKYLVDESGIPLRRFNPIVTVREIYDKYISPSRFEKRNLMKYRRVFTA